MYKEQWAVALCKEQKKEGWAEWRIGRGIMSYKGLLWWAERSQVHQVTSLSAEHLTSYKGKWDLSKEQEAIRKAHTVTGQSVMSGDQFFSYMPTDHYAPCLPRLVSFSIFLSHAFPDIEAFLFVLYWSIAQNILHSPLNVSVTHKYYHIFTHLGRSVR